MIYVVWLTEVDEFHIFVGATTTKDKAKLLAKRAYKSVKNKASMPDDLDEKNFEIEAIKEGAIHSFLEEYE